MVITAKPTGLSARDQVPKDVPIQLGGHRPGPIGLPDRPEAVVVILGRAVRARSLHLEPVAIVRIAYGVTHGMDHAVELVVGEALARRRPDEVPVGIISVGD